MDGAPASPATYRTAVESVDGQTPDTADFHGDYVSAALGASLVVGLAVRLCVGDDPAMAAEAAELAADAAFAELAADAAFAEAQRLDADAGLDDLLKGRLVTAEVGAQSAAIAALASISGPEPGLSARLRSLVSGPARATAG